MEIGNIDYEKASKELSLDEVLSMGIGAKDKNMLLSIFGTCRFFIVDDIFHIEIADRTFESDDFEKIICMQAKRDLESERDRKMTGLRNKLDVLRSNDNKQSKNNKTLESDFDEATVWQVYSLMKTEGADFETSIALTGEMFGVPLNRALSARVRKQVGAINNIFFGKKRMRSEVKNSLTEIELIDKEISEGDIIARAKKMVTGAQRSIEAKVNKYLEVRRSQEWLEGKLAKNRVAGRRKNLGGADGINLQNRRINCAILDVLEQEWPGPWMHHALRRVESNV